MNKRSLLLVLVLLALATPVYAQTPTPEPADIPVPAGWGPEGQINIINHSGNVELRIDNDLICNQGINLWRTYFLDPTGYVLPLDPPAVVNMRIQADYGDGDPGSWMLRLRFAYWGNPALLNTFDSNLPVAGIGVYVYDQSGTNMLRQTQAVYCPESIIGTAIGDDYGCDPVVPGYPDWRLFDKVLLVRDFSQLSFVLTDGHFNNPLDPNYDGFVISSLYAENYYRDFPASLCGAVLPPTPTTMPTWTPLPTWTSTPMTPTATMSATVVGATATPSLTPIPFTTWTPSPSPTRYRTPMATLASWQITPDASFTPLPSATAGGLPTVAWPTVETVTPFPTVVPVGYVTLGATATPYTMTNVPAVAFGLVDDLEASIDYSGVYSSVQSLSANVSAPLRVIRGTVRVYMPVLAPLIDAIILGLFIVLGVLAWIALIAAVKFIIRIIEVIMEIIPL